MLYYYYYKKKKTWATCQGFCKEQQLLMKVSALSWMQHWKKCFIPPFPLVNMQFAPPMGALLQWSILLTCFIQPLTLNEMHSNMCSCGILPAMTAYQIFDFNSPHHTDKPCYMQGLCAMVKN